MKMNPRRTQKISSSGVLRIVLAAQSQVNPHAESHPLRKKSKINQTFLAVARSVNDALDEHARQVIAAAAILADDSTAVLAVIFGALNAQSQADLALLGTDEFIFFDKFSIDNFQPDIELNQLLSIVNNVKPKHIFMPDNAIGDGDLGRRLIAKSALTAATQVVEIDTNHVAIAANNELLICQQLPAIILLANNAVDTNLPFASKAVRRMDVGLQSISTSTYHDLGMQKTAAANVALEEADFVISAGNGVQNIETFNNLASQLDAAIGASRVAVDDGKFARDKQIGASGKTISASTYIAIGISGAVQHLQGIKDCRQVIAINLDASAPIVKRANLTVIGDAEEIMQSLIQLIDAAKARARLEAA
jgi:electron transfer flavoprotein alpha subunit